MYPYNQLMEAEPIEINSLKDGMWVKEQRWDCKFQGSSAANDCRLLTWISDFFCFLIRKQGWCTKMLMIVYWDSPMGWWHRVYLCFFYRRLRTLCFTCNMVSIFSLFTSPNGVYLCVMDHIMWQLIQPFGRLNWNFRGFIQSWVSSHGKKCVFIRKKTILLGRNC